MNEQGTKKELFGPIIFLLVGLMVVFTSFYFGGVTPGGTFGMEILMVVASLFWVKQWSCRQQVVIPRPQMLLPLLLLVVLAFISRYYSIYQFASKFVFLQALTYVGVMIVVSSSFSHKQLHIFARILIALAVAMAIVGFLSFLFRRYDFLFYYKRFYHGRVTGTFINPNHFACFLNIVLPFVLYFIVSNQGKSRRAYFLIFAFLFVSLVMTFSFGGIIAFLIGLVAYLYMFIHIVEKIKIRSVHLWLTLCSLVFVVFMIVLLFSFMDLDLEKKRHSLLTHYQLFRGGIEYFRHHITAIFAGTSNRWELVGRLLGGYGFGTYSLVYNQYTPMLGKHIYQHAHNDYLQIAVEGGLIGVTLLLWFYVAVLERAWSGFKYAEGQAKLLYASMVMAFLSFFLHSLISFNLQIPANVLLIFILIGFMNMDSRNTVISMRSNRALLFIAVCAILLYGVMGARAFLGEFVNMQAVKLSRSGNFKEANSSFDTALLMSPDNADIQREFAEALFTEGKRQKNTVAKEQYYAEAYNAFQHAIELTPYNAKFYARVGDLEVERKNNVSAEEYYDRSVSLAPHFFTARLKRLEFYLRDISTYQEKALSEYTYILDNIHPFAFENIKERKDFLQYLLRSLDSVTDKRFDSIKERIQEHISWIT